ncbi:hypothetical protein M0638_05800 [Roseomonas sp. NAR14]|uniref:Uncharacterized protein n=1 Tax=Roseomonas acroporae TaxID=2937791 RepID=A0A9X1Y4P7_9PROT|nr:hypothetical protein [Roseomonas acroporae]MCK8783894.1 hypothetical protein [Roseomonas acroporae]
MTQTAAFLLSVLVEAVAAALLVAAAGWGRLQSRPGSPSARAALAALAGTALTHPAVWHGVPPLADRLGYGTAVLLAEGAVVLAEAPAYRLLAALPWPRALLVSLLANAASTAAGLLLYALGRA